MKRYLGNRWIRIAIGLFALGSLPLAVLALLAVGMPWLAPASAAGELLWLVTLWPATDQGSWSRCASSRMRPRVPAEMNRSGASTERLS